MNAAFTAEGFESAIKYSQVLFFQAARNDVALLGPAFLHFRIIIIELDVLDRVETLDVLGDHLDLVG